MSDREKEQALLDKLKKLLEKDDFTILNNDEISVLRQLIHVFKNKDAIEKLEELLEKGALSSLTKEDLDTVRLMIRVVNILKGIGVAGTWLKHFALWVAGVVGFWLLVKQVIQAAGKP